MPIGYWFITDFSEYACYQAYHIQISTDEICHLWLRWSLTTPQKHPRQRRLRGVEVKGDVYYCFVRMKDVEQEEAGDTLIHTFTVSDWPACQTRWFYFHGTYNAIPSPSTSAIFGRHLDFESQGIAKRIAYATDEVDYVSPNIWSCWSNCPGSFHVGRWYTPADKLGCGLRFRDMPIPKCAQITSATITFVASWEFTHVPVNTQFGVEDAPNPPNFLGTTVGEFLTRRGTRRVVTPWDALPPWYYNTMHKSLDLSPLFQYAVNLPGYQKWNAIVIFWDDISHRTPWSPLRARVAFTYSNDPNKAPYLEITYDAWRADDVS